MPKEVEVAIYTAIALVLAGVLAAIINGIFMLRGKGIDGDLDTRKTTFSEMESSLKAAREEADRAENARKDLEEYHKRRETRYRSYASALREALRYHLQSSMSNAVIVLDASHPFQSHMLLLQWPSFDEDEPKKDEPVKAAGKKEA